MEIKYFMRLKLWNRYFTLRTSAFDENEYEKNEIKQDGFRMDEGVNPIVYPQRM